MSRWKYVAVGGLGLGLVGWILASIDRKSTSTPSRIALIGDSYAVGLGPYLAKLLPVFKYEGHVGISTDGWLSCSTCGAWLSSFKPDLVVVSLGVNDENPILANYQAIVRRVHGIGARVIWIQPPADVRTQSIGAVRADIAALGIPVVPATTTPLAGDNLHPQSYSSWSREIFNYIK